MCLSREPVSVAWWIVCVSGDGNGGGVYVCVCECVSVVCVCVGGMGGW